MASETEFLLGVMCLQGMTIAAAAAAAAIGGARAAFVVAAGLITLFLVGWCLYRTGRRTTPVNR